MPIHTQMVKIDSHNMWRAALGVERGSGIQGLREARRAQH
jgi:hypothetical protein